MGFWVFMFVMNLILPLSMIGVGAFFVKHAPSEINMVFGYRTRMATKNQDTWAFAHLYFGKLWRIIGQAMLLLSIIGMLILIGRTEHTVGVAGSVIMGVQCVLLIVPVIPTEIALRKYFDQNGNRRQ